MKHKKRMRNNRGVAYSVYCCRNTRCIVASIHSVHRRHTSCTAPAYILRIAACGTVQGRHTLCISTVIFRVLLPQYALYTGSISCSEYVTLVITIHAHPAVCRTSTRTQQRRSPAAKHKTQSDFHICIS